MIKPIHRIPQTDSEQTLGQIANTEMREGWDPQTALLQLSTHTDDAEHIRCTLDWAMQLRETLGIDWGDAIEVAMTLYFG